MPLVAVYKSEHLLTYYEYYGNKVKGLVFCDQLLTDNLRRLKKILTRVDK